MIQIGTIRHQLRDNKCKRRAFGKQWELERQNNTKFERGLQRGKQTSNNKNIKNN